VDYWRSIFSEVLKHGLETPKPDKFNLYSHTYLTPAEREKIDAMCKKIDPMEELPGAAELLKTKGAVHAQFGCEKSYEGGLEVVAYMDPNDIKTKGNMLYMPTLQAA